MCQRDYTNFFWGAYTGFYDQYCIPDFEISTACREVDSTLGLVGRCNPASYVGTIY